MRCGCRLMQVYAVSCIGQGFDAVACGSLRATAPRGRDPGRGSQQGAAATTAETAASGTMVMTPPGVMAEGPAGPRMRTCVQNRPSGPVPARGLWTKVRRGVSGAACGVRPRGAISLLVLALMNEPGAGNSVNMFITALVAVLGLLTVKTIESGIVISEQNRRRAALEQRERMARDVHNQCRQYRRRLPSVR